MKIGAAGTVYTGQAARARARRPRAPPPHPRVVPAWFPRAQAARVHPLALCAVDPVCSARYTAVQPQNYSWIYKQLDCSS